MRDQGFLLSGFYRSCRFEFLEQPTCSNLQGFNSTLTEPVESSGRRGGDQIKEMELKLRQELKGPLATLCSDPKTTVIVLSGSDRSVLDDVQLCSQFIFLFL